MESELALMIQEGDLRAMKMPTQCGTAAVKSIFFSQITRTGTENKTGTIIMPL